ncbi:MULTISPECIES: hypothetical protein [unclassified Jeotgalibaca]
MEKTYLLITSFIIISLLAYFKVQNLANLVLVRIAPDNEDH